MHVVASARPIRTLAVGIQQLGVNYLTKLDKNQSGMPCDDGQVVYSGVQRCDGLRRGNLRMQAK
jgi:hypothetical protein